MYWPTYGPMLYTTELLSENGMRYQLLNTNLESKNSSDKENIQIVQQQLNHILTCFLFQTVNIFNTIQITKLIY